MRIGQQIVTVGCLVPVLFALALWVPVTGWGPVHARGNDLDEIRLSLGAGLNPGEVISGWEALLFPKVPEHTRYRVVSQEDKPVVEARSQASASGLIRFVRIDPREFPVVQWRWKVENIYKKGDARSRQGDDFPARLYINFAFDPENSSFWDKLTYSLARQKLGENTPFRAINYVWASHTPQGEILPNPYTGQTMMVVVSSGAERLGQWVTFKRNIHQDYQQAFGQKPTVITSVAIMTDSDNTGEAGQAFYGDIVFSRE